MGYPSKRLPYRHTVRSLIFMTVALCLCTVPGLAQKKITSDRYKLKAAFLARFLKFVEWPEEALNNSEIVIGVIGKDPVDDFFTDHMKKPVKGRQLRVKRFRKYKPELEGLSEVNLLFIGESEGRHTDDILKEVSAYNILTVGETKNFIEDGGMISFVDKPSAVTFEINQQASNDQGLLIKSTLLKRAVRLIRKD